MQQAILMAVLMAMVYTVSLDLRPDDFRYLARHPLASLLGASGRLWGQGAFLGSSGNCGSASVMSNQGALYATNT